MRTMGLLLLAACAPQPTNDTTRPSPTVPLPTTPVTSSTTEIPIEPGYCEARYYDAIAVSLDNLFFEILYDADGRELRAYEYYNGERRAEHRWYYDDQDRLVRLTTDIDLDGQTDWEYHYTWAGDQLIEEVTYDPVADVDHCSVVNEYDDADALPERSVSGCLDQTVTFTYLTGSPDPLATAEVDQGQDGTIDSIKTCDWDPAAQTHTCVLETLAFDRDDSILSTTYDGDLEIQVRADDQADGIWDYIKDLYHDPQDRLERTQTWSSWTDETTTVSVVWTCF